MTVKKGTDNLRNRLTEDDVMAIYENQEASQSDLAKFYGVTQGTINHILRGRTWNWLTKHNG